MNDPLKPLFSEPTGELARLARDAAASGKLTEQVRAALPENLRPHVLSAVRRDTDLVVIVDSAVWAARVRYAARALGEAIEAAGGAPVGKLRVKVRGGGGSG
ncbi:MAG TPA: DciA family protein [Steroidobacteraceae bacterium]|nr:DciA family protein [Steroidobacteraceae bacterium]